MSCQNEKEKVICSHLHCVCVYMCMCQTINPLMHYIYYNHINSILFMCVSDNLPINALQLSYQYYTLYHIGVNITELRLVLMPRMTKMMMSLEIWGILKTLSPSGSLRERGIIDKESLEFFHLCQNYHLPQGQG